MFFFATIGIGARLVSERSYLLDRAGRNLINSACANICISFGANCVLFVSPQGVRDPLGEHWSNAGESLSPQPLARGETLRVRARAERARGNTQNERRTSPEQEQRKHKARTEQAPSRHKARTNEAQSENNAGNTKERIRTKVAQSKKGARAEK
jgi:hypothetical protein